MKRIIAAVLLIVTLFLILLPAAGESAKSSAPALMSDGKSIITGLTELEDQEDFQAASPQSIKYTGEGIKYRSREDATGARTFSQISELDVAYITCSKPWLAPGEPTIWTAVARGGSGGYSYRFALYFKTVQEPIWYYLINESTYGAGNTFTHTPLAHGTYFLILYIKDSAGQTLQYYSQTYETSLDGRLAQKVREVAALCNASAAGSYEKALFMHDWLARNAYYSFGGPAPHKAEGVLLYGQGVCESYALAYQMLLTEVGVSSIFVQGDAGGPHGWNIVKMGGYWYHVDVTWDDISWGSPSRAYFGLPDALMRRDHSWTYKYPGCISAYYADEPLETGWFDVKTAWYFLKPDRLMQTGWLKDGNSWYYLDSSGAMQTGWVKDGTKWYYMNPAKSASGVMKTGWIKDGSQWYFMNSGGAMKTGWIKDKQNWYFLNSNGAMETGWVKDAGSWYFMGSSGAMQTGWLLQDGTWYYLLGSGAMATGLHKIDGRSSSFSSSGAWLGYK